MTTPTASRSVRRSRDYYFGISVVILLLSVWGFSDNLFWDVGQPSNSDPKFIVHGLFCLAWMVMLVVQTSLVRQRNVRLHMKLGLLGMAIAAGVTISTVYVFVVIWSGWENMAPFVKANRILFASYSICVVAAFLNRRRPDWHKRLMIVATLFMMEPILSRVFGTMEMTVLRGMTDSQLDLYWYFVVFALWGALFASLLWHDLKTLKRVHPVSICGAGWVVAVWIAVQFI